MSIQCRPYQPDDWPGTWAILKPVFRAGETYPMAPDITEEAAHYHWIESTTTVFLALSDTDDSILGTYYLKPNSAALGAHVCNAGYVVGESERGQGIGTGLGKHSLKQAAALGFHAMQFNLVVASNEASVRLWRKLDFDLVGTLPRAFKHAELGYIDALVLYKMLVDH